MSLTTTSIKNWRFWYLLDTIYLFTTPKIQATTPPPLSSMDSLSYACRNHKFLPKVFITPPPIPFQDKHLFLYEKVHLFRQIYRSCVERKAAWFNNANLQNSNKRSGMQLKHNSESGGGGLSRGWKSFWFVACGRRLKSGRSEVQSWDLNVIFLGFLIKTLTESRFEKAVGRKLDCSNYIFFSGKIDYTKVVALTIVNSIDFAFYFLRKLFINALKVEFSFVVFCIFLNTLMFILKI